MHLHGAPESVVSSPENLGSPGPTLAARIAVVSVASNPDILIVGAGLAGAAAAEALAARGFTLTVLEARNRVGGRGFSRPFANSDELLEFGGAWIRPWQTQIHAASRSVCLRRAVAMALNGCSQTALPGMARHCSSVLALPEILTRKGPARSMRPFLASSPKQSWSHLTGMIGSAIRLRAVLGSRRC